MGLVAFLLLVAWPVTEIYLVTLVGPRLGWGLTLLLLLLLSLFGVWVLRSTGRATRRLIDDAAGGTRTLPTGPAAADTGLRFLAGLLLLVPGFASGTLGLLLLVPPVRWAVQAAGGAALVRRFPVVRTSMTRIRLWRPDGEVIEGEVVDPDQRQDRRSGDDPPALS